MSTFTFVSFLVIRLAFFSFLNELEIFPRRNLRRSPVKRNILLAPVINYGETVILAALGLHNQLYFTKIVEPFAWVSFHRQGDIVALTDC